ncbi:tyrosine-type recombinase/integrase [Actinoplanes xinjiangensis]
MGPHRHVRRVHSGPHRRSARRPRDLNVDRAPADHALDSVSGPDARLFTGPRGGGISTAVLGDATHWDEVVTALGYEHLRRHDLRHTGLTRLADAGVKPHVLRKIAGHGSVTTTQRSLHPDQRSINEAGHALSAHLRAPRSPTTCRLSTQGR